MHAIPSRAATPPRRAPSRTRRPAGSGRTTSLWSSCADRPAPETLPPHPTLFKGVGR
ncbi:MAG: hypothetical protein JO252_10975 [Planctomycetaceae bacterium]|nr:hypothetical protein [Planctomycetaceae bacterium]